MQRDPANAQAWFQLGVKQQENEREGKAIQALRRALELDAAHLPSWLALAISQTGQPPVLCLARSVENSRTPWRKYCGAQMQ